MKSLLIGLLLVVSGWGQTTGQDVVYVPILTNASYTTAGVINITSGNLQNIGQTSHIVKLVFAATTGSASFIGSMQGSIDGTTYFNIGPVITSGTLPTGTGLTVTLVGYGSFPYLVVKGTLTIGGAPPHNVTLSELYTGTSAPVFNGVDQFSSNGGLRSFSSDSLTFGTDTLIATPSGGTTIAVYGISVFGTSSLTEFILECKGATNPTVLLDIVNGTNLAFISPTTIRGYPPCNAVNGSTLYYNATGSGAASVNVQYRTE